MSAKCVITYSDGSIWLQTVFVALSPDGFTVSDRHDVGTEVSPPSPSPSP
jgi:hypothetical protein